MDRNYSSPEYRPFFAKRLTILPKTSNLNSHPNNTQNREYSYIDVENNGKLASPTNKPILSRKTDGAPHKDVSPYDDISDASDDSDGMVIDLDPPASYQRRPSLNCFLKPKEVPHQPPKIKVASRKSSAIISDKHSQSDRKRTEKRMKKTQERACQTECEYTVGGSSRASTSRYRHVVDYERRRRVYEGESENSIRSRRREKGGRRLKRHLSPLRPWLDDPCSGSDSEMDPPIRCSDC